MGFYIVVNPATLVGGTPEDVSQVLANFNAIAAVLNGGLDHTNLAAGAAILKTQLAALGIVDADVAAGAALGIAKLAGYPTDISKLLKGDGSWGQFGVYRKSTAKVVANSVAETDLLNGEITV